MSPSRNTKTGLLAAVASSDDEHRALNRISSAGSGNQRDNASPMSSPIKDQAVENSKVSLLASSSCWGPSTYSYLGVLPKDR
jgi:hypothetical protein